MPRCMLARFWCDYLHMLQKPSRYMHVSHMNIATTQNCRISDYYYCRISDYYYCRISDYYYCIYSDEQDGSSSVNYLLWLSPSITGHA
jgi:hypothetical protein